MKKEKISVGSDSSLFSVCRSTPSMMMKELSKEEEKNCDDGKTSSKNEEKYERQQCKKKLRSRKCDSRKKVKSTH